MLTGLLVNLFVRTGKPIFLIDGTQPNLGKTLLATVIGIVLDGTVPALIKFTPNDDELAKCLCAQLRELTQSVIIVDNAKATGGGIVNSPVLEANSTAPVLSFRILGHSVNHRRPNDQLWTMTMNDTKASPDLVSRGVPIRFLYEGKTEGRVFDGREPSAYALEHRDELLAELAGMVVRWTEAGRPRGRQSHRCTRWAEVVGGILEANGLPEFLANRDEAAAEFNVALDELALLAEAVVRGKGPVVYVNNDTNH